MNAFVAMMVTAGLFGDAELPSVYGTTGYTPAPVYTEGDCHSSCNGCEEDDDGHCCRCHSTCDMPQHFPYPPVYHGYYYFRPYNYTNVLRDRTTVLQLQGDVNAPYWNGMFDEIYAAGVYEEDMGHSQVPAPIIYVDKQLPDLEEIVAD